MSADAQAPAEDDADAEVVVADAAAPRPDGALPDAGVVRRSTCRTTPR